MSKPPYLWPSAASFGRTIPKAKFYEHARTSTKVREKFVSQVHRITWEYKLAESTIGLQGDESVPEIQVFAIEAKGSDVGDDVLATIDRTVRTQVIFEITQNPDTGAKVRTVGTFKTLGQKAPTPSLYFSTDWTETDSLRTPLPPSLDLPGLHTQLLAPLLPLERRKGESLRQTIDRVSQANKLEREISKLERALKNEAQFNRKVDLRRQVRETYNALDALTDHRITREVAWRN